MPAFGTRYVVLEVHALMQHGQSVRPPGGAARTVTLGEGPRSLHDWPTWGAFHVPSWRDTADQLQTALGGPLCAWFALL